ncbi:MAG: class I SAM-dependent methyltransferase [Methanotrichaceae archaeon]|nr:class I SAM-dependent methyltransferase [Methanotrichaceae archaeon]
MNKTFSNPDPWKYFASEYEQIKYKRQIDVIKDRKPNPERILELVSAEGAQTLLLAKQFSYTKITGIEISPNAFRIAQENLKGHRGRIELVNADMMEHEPRIEENTYDVCIWSESVYYIGARLTFNDTYEFLKKMVGKLRAGGLLVMANTVDLSKDLPEWIVTERPLINCYYNFLSSLITPALKSIYIEQKLGRIYEYQIWAFQR